MNTWLVSIIWSGIHCVLDPFDGVFGRFDLAALCGCHRLKRLLCLVKGGTTLRRWAPPSSLTLRRYSHDLASSFFLSFVIMVMFCTRACDTGAW